MMLLKLSISIFLASLTTGTVLRANTRSHAVPASSVNGVWTNEDTQRLSEIPGLISVVGQRGNEASDSGETRAPMPKAKDPSWYASQAANLNAELEAEQADLHNFTQALEDARELKATTSGINLGAEDVGITPEATIEILRNRMRETQGELDTLEDLARRNGIEPGILRGQVSMGDNLELTSGKED